MARRRRRRIKDHPLDYLTLPRLGLNPEIKKSIWALFLLAAGIICLMSLVDSAGALGIYLQRGLAWTFGWGQWLFPLLLFIWALFIFFREKLAISFSNYLGMFLVLAATHGLLQLIIDEADWPLALRWGEGGGHLGYLIAANLLTAVGLVGSFVVTVFLLLVGLMFMFNSTLANLLFRGSWPARLLLHPFKFIYQKLSGKKTIAEGGEAAEGEEMTEEKFAEAGEEETEEEAGGEEIYSKKPLLAGGKNEPVENIWQPTNIKIDLPIDLLNVSSGKPVAADIKNGQKVIQKTLEEFGIMVEMGAVAVGPTVTQYTLRPADGIKLSRITNLNNDLAMALAAHPVRIEAPIPGKSLVGIEVPNKSIALVSLREVLSSNEFKNRQTNSTIALGKDVAGKVWVADIRKMPHLLVAGATGSGKSVMLNSIIVSLLYQNNPDDLRFVMIDPKRVELTIYNGIPHLLTPVITEVGKTVNALKWCLNEMDRRFKILAKTGKRDIASFNQTNRQKMPYIVFIIDELADLMLLAGREVEAGVVRLAQMARAVGIHLILATQRPSVNIITGTIKANMPARIAFAVASSIDSRTILDGMGAEKLLGRGDMLFSDASMPKPKRLQGAFVGEKEIRRVITEIKRQGGSADYLADVTERQKVIGMAGVGMDGNVSDDDDELTQAAKEVVVNAGKASATLLQRKLSVGYARAAKILDILEEQGIIGQSQGSKPREILISKEQLSALQSTAVSGAPLHRRATSKPPQNYLSAEEEESEEDETEDKEDEETAEDTTADEEIVEENEIEEEIEAGETEEKLRAKPSSFASTYAKASVDKKATEDKKDDYDFDKYFSR